MQEIKNQKIKFMQVDIPDGITAFLESKSGISRGDKPKTYTISEIIHCLRKSFYSKSGKQRKSKMYDNLWPAVRGNLLHQMTKAYKWNELDMDFDIPIGDGKVATISGRLDMYDWKTKTIIDLKTTRDVYSQAECGTIPKKEDMLQIQCYGTIFSNTIPVENLVLVYADLNEMIAFKVACEDKTWWLKERILELNRSLIYDNPPQKEISKMCNLCKYRNQCKPDSPTTLSYDNMTTSCIENGELIK